MSNIERDEWKRIAKEAIDIADESCAIILAVGSRASDGTLRTMTFEYGDRALGVVLNQLQCKNMVEGFRRKGCAP